MPYKFLALFILLRVITVPAQAQNTESCFFTPAAQTVPLYHAPLTDPTQQKDIVSSGHAYPITMQNEMHFYIAFDDAYGGWVDRRSGGISGACDAIPQDTTPLSDFPTVCILHTLSEVQMYDEPQLLTPRDLLPEGVAFPVTYRHDNAYYLLIDSAYGGWVSGVGANVQGNCESIAFNPGTTYAYATENARAWSMAGVDTGEIISEIVEGTPLLLISPPVEGGIRTDTEQRGYWYLVALDSETAPLGWVWEGRLDFDTTPPTNPAGIVTRSEARLWSQPDIYSGEIIGTLATNMPVTLLEGPVQGIIRYDTGASGTWYQVEANNGLIGWIWSGRLAF